MSGISKQQWRHDLRQARKDFVASLTADMRQKLAVDLAMMAGPHVAPFKTIGSYVATGSEIDPQPITDALQNNASIALPRVREAGMPLTFHMITVDTKLLPGYGNIHAPPDYAPVMVPDVLLLPLVGVDRRGVRLGQGQGHYDATIADLRARGHIFVIGIAYDCQLVDALPAEPHDQRLDALATPTSFMSFV